MRYHIDIDLEVDGLLNEPEFTEWVKELSSQPRVENVDVSVKVVVDEIDVDVRERIEPYVRDPA